jgi:hypothetical protein
MAAPGIADLFVRLVRRSRVPYVDITGTTNATLNTQTLFTHTLVDNKGAAVAPSRIHLLPNTATAAAVGILYEVAANHTTTQVDIRSTVASTPFRARLWA